MANGETVDFPATVPAEVKVNHELVRLLESALSDAKAGRIVAGAVIVVPGSSSFMALSSMSNFPGEIIAGAEVLKSDMIIRLRQGPQSRVLRPGMR